VPPQTVMWLETWVTVNQVIFTNGIAVPSQPIELFESNSVSFEKEKKITEIK